jgi:hypothetical protein
MRCSYLAVRGLSKADAYEHLGFAEKELTDPHVIEEFQGAELPGGWILVVAHRMEWASLERAERLSADGALVIGTSMTTVVMYSEAFAYEGGIRKWRIEHDPENADPLKIEGEAPAELAAIHAKLAAEQEEGEEENVDYIFDAPAALCQALHGYRIDEDGPDPQPVFYLLEPTRPQFEKRGLFGLLGGIFGKR